MTPFKSKSLPHKHKVLIKNRTGATIRKLMAWRTINSLLSNLNILDSRGPGNPEVRGIAYDSRRVQPGDLFVAMQGFHTDGHLYIEQAVLRGAVAVVHSRPLPVYGQGTSYIRVHDSRLALSTLAASFYSHPSANLTVIGVTGTDGKSTTVWLIHQLLEALGKSSGFLSTVNFKTGDEVQKNSLRQSTPEAPEVQGMLRKMVENGKDYAVIEATSHGLSERTGRLVDVLFDIAVLTNLSREHLEFHGTLEQYRSDKANLFRSLAGRGRSLKPAQESFAVLNLDDPHCHFFSSQTEAAVFTYSLKSKEADLFASDLEADIRGNNFTFHYKGKKVKALSKLPGLYNAQNLLAASLTVMQALKIDLNRICPLLPELRGVEGRMEIIDQGQPFRVIVDYAHTPESFEKLFALVKSYTEGALLAVFGSAGERDIEKRPSQGRIASEFCDLIVLSDEDPRGEDSSAILQEIAAGCRDRKIGKNLFLVPDRREAIGLALAQAHKEDTVLLLGKGHEESIIYAHGPVKWDEAEAARSILTDMGYRR